jgi:hypothetical protein
MRLDPRVGEEFPFDAQFLNARRDWLEEITRSSLAAVITLVAVVFLIGAALAGWETRDFSYLDDVWRALAFPLGAVTFHYLSGRRRG